MPIVRGSERATGPGQRLPAPARREEGRVLKPLGGTAESTRLLGTATCVYRDHDATTRVLPRALGRREGQQSTLRQCVSSPGRSRRRSEADRREARPPQARSVSR